MRSVPVDVLPEHLLQANGIRLNRGEGGPLPADASLFEIVNDFERRIIIERLEQCSWSQTEAAESLHVPLSTLNQKIKRLDIKIRKKGRKLTHCLKIIRAQTERFLVFSAEVSAELL